MALKKWVVVALIVAIVVVAAVGVYFLTRPAPAPPPKMKVALILPGAKDDLSWNEMAYHGLEAIEKEFDVETAYSEWVPPPDAERYIRDYADLGYNVIFVHD
ncbi:MAG: BMP family ABC transporter substrate-binding protein, partial [Candidatus Zixiibacteriota bacterium]